jgi:2,5-diamino-6-(ribosylamino)-4(3H)-pyrimidinone 5'-phosphate reductase
MLIPEGGAKSNGSFLAADLIDEVSTLVAPIADGAIGTPSLSDAREEKVPTRHLRLAAFEEDAGDLFWLRYRRER